MYIPITPTLFARIKSTSPTLIVHKQGGKYKTTFLQKLIQTKNGPFFPKSILSEHSMFLLLDTIAG